jgi:hypothetical protein
MWMTFLFYVVGSKKSWRIMPYLWIFTKIGRGDVCFGQD